MSWFVFTIRLPFPLTDTLDQTGETRRRARGETTRKPTAPTQRQRIDTNDRPSTPTTDHRHQRQTIDTNDSESKQRRKEGEGDQSRGGRSMTNPTRRRGRVRPNATTTRVMQHGDDSDCSRMARRHEQVGEGGARQAGGAGVIRAGERQARQRYGLTTTLKAERQSVRPNDEA